MENVLKVLTATNLLFILKGLWLTLQISFILKELFCSAQSAQNFTPAVNHA